MPTYKGKVCAPPKAAKGPAFKDTKPSKTSPNKQQFEPTTGSPVRQLYKMGGGS